MSTVELHIERLVIEEELVTHRNTRMLQAAVESELARLLTQDGLARRYPSHGETVARIVGPAIQFNGSSDATDFGRQIAGAVYGGIEK